MMKEKKKHFNLQSISFDVSTIFNNYLSIWQKKKSRVMITSNHRYLLKNENKMIDQFYFVHW